jgi:hypothetical protein
MLEKLERAAYWQNGDSKTTLLNTFSKGFDKDQLEKIASEEAIKYEEWVDIMPKEGKAYVHVVTTGAGEFYGPNVNADYYNEDHCRVIFPKPGAGIEKTATLDGGLRKYHNTYMKHGGVYTEHQNSRKGFEKQGNIFAERYNDKMHRGELILELDVDKWRPTLQKLASGDPVFLSQGSSLKFDVCSICGNRATKMSDYCDHLKYNKLGITKEGHQVFAYNDTPIFHDISFVAVPADKTAFALAKVANVTGEIINEKALYVPAHVMHEMYYGRKKDRMELLQKLAAMEAELSDNVPEQLKDVQKAVVLDDDAEKEVINALDGLIPGDILKVLHENNEMLPPKAFIKVMVKKEPEEFEGIEEALPTVFSDILNNPEVIEDVVEDGSYVPEPSCGCKAAKRVAQEIEPLIGMDEDPVKHRIIKVTIKGEPEEVVEKESSAITPEVRYIAREYAKYQLGFLEKNASEENIKLTVLSNKRN